VELPLSEVTIEDKPSISRGKQEEEG